MSAEYICTVCKKTKTDITISGCGDPKSRVVDVPIESLNGHVVWKKMTSACPLEIKNPVRRFLYYKFKWKFLL